MRYFVSLDRLSNMGRGAIVSGARRTLLEFRGTAAIFTGSNNSKSFHAATEPEKVFSLPSVHRLSNFCRIGISF